MSNLPRILLWLAISVLGAVAVGVSAFHSGETINAMWLVVAGLCTFAVSYRFYSKWLVTKVLVADERRAPPAITKNDGKDFVPTHKWVVFGHHFAAIAGPGPLVGPVLAAQFGYLPGMLWILIGATLGGGVHDAVVLFASMRRNGKGLGQMLKEEINPIVGTLAMVSLLAIMTILLAVLGLVVVNALADSPWGLFTIAATIPLALLMGSALRFTKIGITPVSVAGVVGLLLAVWGGKYLKEWGWDDAFTLSGTKLSWSIIIYGFAASVLPVWLLLAPRDYLSTFMKLGTVAVLGLVIIWVAPQLQMPKLTSFIHGGGLIVPGPVFPFVCITIACGAVSGFHSLISSGTTPKLLDNENAIRVVGYGAMITEMLVALLALVSACALEPGQYFAINSAKGAEPAAVVAKVTTAGFPVTEAGMSQLATELGEKTMFGRAGGAPTFAVSLAHMFSKVFPGEGMMSLWYHFAIMFEALFILTTLDAGTRVGRFILQDLLGQIWKPLGNTQSWLGNLFASALFVSGWGWFMYQGVVDENGGIKSLWPLFGVANQLLAVIAFALGTTVLIKMGRARYAWCTLIPLVYLLIVTLTAGLMLIFNEKFGFLSLAAGLEKQIAAGAQGPALVVLQKKLFNQYLDAGVAGLFLVLVVSIVIGCVTEWVKILSGSKKAELHESPYVSLPEAA
jgi:carbon starvation protein